MVFLSTFSKTFGIDHWSMLYALRNDMLVLKRNLQDTRTIRQFQYDSQDYIANGVVVKVNPMLEILILIPSF